MCACVCMYIFISNHVLLEFRETYPHNNSPIHFIGQVKSIPSNTEL